MALITAFFLITNVILLRKGKCRYKDTLNWNWNWFHWPKSELPMTIKHTFRCFPCHRTQWKSQNFSWIYGRKDDIAASFLGIFPSLAIILTSLLWESTHSRLLLLALWQIFWHFIAIQTLKSKTAVVIKQMTISHIQGTLLF